MTATRYLGVDAAALLGADPPLAFALLPSARWLGAGTVAMGCALVVWWAGNPETAYASPPCLAALLLLVGAGALLAAVDLAVRRLPNAVVLPLGGRIAALLALAALAGADADRLPRALLGGVALAVVFALLALGGGLGWGDVKLSLSIGLVLAWGSWEALIVGTVTALLLAGAEGTCRLARVWSWDRHASGSRPPRPGADGPDRHPDGRDAVGEQAEVAFGPWLLAGLWAGVLGCG